VRISVHEEVTVGEILERIAEQHGSRRELAARVRKHPRDREAKLALHDLDEYGDADPATRIRQTRTLIVPLERVDLLTAQRISLLFAVRAKREPPSVRELARRVKRDVKNVSQDVSALADLGLLKVEGGGRGRPKKVSLAGDSIDLHIVEA
jgi:DNA-binding transcriptional ArsR family regulator